MKALALIALLIGCNCATASRATYPLSQAPDLVTAIKHPDGCRTTCGLHAPEYGDCDDLERYEREIVKGLGASQNDWTPESVCKAISGYKIVVRERRPVDSLCDQHGGGWVAFFTPMGYFCAQGWTDNETKRIELAHDNWRKTPLAHELVHAIEGQPGHCRWANLPLRIAVSELMGEPDESQPEPIRCATWDAGFR